MGKEKPDITDGIWGLDGEFKDSTVIILIPPVRVVFQFLFRIVKTSKDRKPNITRERLQANAKKKSFKNWTFVVISCLDVIAFVLAVLRYL